MKKKKKKRKGDTWKSLKNKEKEMEEEGDKNGRPKPAFLEFCCMREIKRIYFFLFLVHSFWVLFCLAFSGH